MNSMSHCESEMSGCISQQVNVGDTERLASILGGGLVLISMARFGSLTSVLGTLLGAGLIYRGLTGHCHLYEALEMNTNDECGESMDFDRSRESSDQDVESGDLRNRVEIASTDSFPASDPPAWTGVAT